MLLAEWSRGGMGGISAMKKLRQLKRYVRSGNAFGSGYLRDIGKDKNKCTGKPSVGPAAVQLQL